MRNTTLITGIAISMLALMPAVASASNACERDKHDKKVTGTVVGALGGAVLGSMVAGSGHKTGGALLGAAGGAVVGNQLSRSKARCPDGYHRAEYRQQRRYDHDRRD